MQLSFSMDEMVEQYIQDQQLNRMKLSQMGRNIAEDDLIQLCYVAFQDCPELQDACDDWDDIEIIAIQDWVNFKPHFIQAMYKNDNCRDTLASTNITNLIHENN